MNLSELTLGELAAAYHLSQVGAIAESGKEILDEMSRRARDARQVSALRDLRTFLGNYQDRASNADREQ